jgi:hypothetical protein
MSEARPKSPSDKEISQMAMKDAMQRRDWTGVVVHGTAVLHAAGEETSSWVYVQMAIAQRKLGNFIALEEILRNGRIHYPTNIKLCHEFVKSSVVRADWREAVIRAREVLNCLGDGTPASIYRMSSMAYRHLDELTAAEAITRRGNKKFPDDVPLALEAVEVALAQGDGQKALNCGQHVLGSHGESARARALIALAHYNLADENVEMAMNAPDSREGVRRLQNVIETYSGKLPASFFEKVAEGESEASAEPANKLLDAVFIWIPKTAGTSIYNALAAAGCQKLKTPELVKHAFCGRGLVTFSHLSYKMLVDEGYIGNDFDRTASKFTFVRNPFRRAVSLYFYVQRYLSTYNKQPSFLEFLELLDTGLYDRVGLYNVKNLSQCNPQVRWLDGIKLDFIGKMECLAEDFIALQHALNLRLPELGIYKAGNYSDPYSLFGNREKYLVEKIYEEDFGTFGYDTFLPRAQGVSGQ